MGELSGLGIGLRSRERMAKATRTPIAAIADINTPNTRNCCHPPRSPESTGSRPQPGFGIALMHSVTLRSRSRYTLSSVASGGIVADAGAPDPTPISTAATAVQIARVTPRVAPCIPPS